MFRFILRCLPTLGGSIFTAAMLSATATRASDWPMWRANAQRTACIDQATGTELHLQWQRELAPASPAWPKVQPKLRFDDAANPVVVGQLVFVNSSSYDSVTAYSTRTGEQVWQYLADGPVRFAPAATSERVYFVSDDGFLYCLSSSDGELIWRKRGGPNGRLLLGNERMISSWPARGAPVLKDGVVYFGASIWPFMGVFIHAVDAETGKSVWTNSGSGMRFTVQPHGASSFASVVPQGHLVADGDHLIIPGGRSVPAVFNRRSGKMLHFDYIKKRGGHNVMAANNQYVVAGDLYRSDDGGQLDSINVDLFDGKQFLACKVSSIVGYAPKFKKIEKITRDRIGREKKKISYEREELWSKEISGDAERLLAKTGDVVWVAEGKKIAAYDLRRGKEDPIWKYRFESDVWDAIFADDRVFVVTKENRVFCFGTDRGVAPVRHLLPELKPHAGPMLGAKEISLVTRGVDTTGGYALVLGVKSGKLIRGLAAHTGMRIIVLPSPNDDVDALKRELIAQDLYGDRIAILSKAVTPRSLPQYFASLICSEYRNIKAEQALRLYGALRPYGGRLVLSGDDAHQHHLKTACASLQDAQATFSTEGNRSAIEREGALPNTDDWTHQYATAAQSGISREAHVQAPFGVLWFGGPSHEGILPRHGHGPSPQVAGGRLVIEGPDLLRSIDIYTGRQLWERELPGLGKFYDNLKHVPGTNEIGSNYVTLADSIYVVYGKRLLELDAATGETTREFGNPADETEEENPHWGYIGVEGDYLVATSSPVKVVKPDESEKVELPDRDVIPKGASWKFLAGDDPSGEWNSLKYIDNEWSEGPAGFGYGDDDDATVLTEMKDTYSRVYLRNSFNGKQLAGAKELKLYCKYDDGFIAYLNGTEICRKHVEKAGRKAKVDSHEAENFEDFELEDWKDLIVPGENVLAIEGHNASKKSSDFSLHPYLAFVPEKSSPPVVERTRDVRSLLEQVRYSSGSLRINVFNRHTGERLWTRDAEHNFRHNNICAGSGRLFCIDLLSVEKRRALERRGLDVETNGRLYSFDLQTGEVVWSTDKNVFGTFLSYSVEHDIVVQGGSVYRDRAYDEIGKGISAFNGSTGEELWSDEKLSYNGPVLLWQDKIVTNGNSGFSLDIYTGKRTGWKYKRDYGCNTAVGCQNFLTFRSGAAGYYDLRQDSGTAHLGGFRSSCSNNLIPAGGLLNAPDYTRTCTCSYQNQTSLALVHMPEAETWAFGGRASPHELAINFGAPGDRRAPNGTLWVDYPSVGGKSPKPNVETQPKPEDLHTFRDHSSLVSGSHDWVCSSGVRGIKEITLTMESDASQTLKLYFSEPDDPARSFDIIVNGTTVERDFTIAKFAGGVRRGITRTHRVVPASGKVRIELKGRDESVLCGLEILGD